MVYISQNDCWSNHIHISTLSSSITQILVSYRSTVAGALGSRPAHPQRGNAAEHAVLAVVDDALASAHPG